MRELLQTRFYFIIFFAQTSMISIQEKTIQSGFPYITQTSRSGAQTRKDQSGGQYRDRTAGGKSQIVRTPLRVQHVSAGKPDLIFLARFESINGRAKTFK